MVYTDGNFLIADSKKELHHAAETMGISSRQYQEYPIECYKLFPKDQKKVLLLEISRLSTPDLIYYCFHHTIR